MEAKAYLEITMIIDAANRLAAAKVYEAYKQPFLSDINGAVSKDLLIREEDVQVLHGFGSVEAAKAYLDSELFKKDVFEALKGLWKSAPEVRIYSVA